MLVFWAVVWRLAFSLWETARDPDFRPVFGRIIATLTLGSVFYWQVEEWSLFDSFYFSVVTLATVGYGDFSPQTTLGKAFTIAYIFLGVGTLALFVNAVARKSLAGSGALGRLTGRHVQSAEAPGGGTTGAGSSTRPATGASDAPVNTTIR